jgi:hypothetical protein
MINIVYAPVRCSERAISDVRNSEEPFAPMTHTTSGSITHDMPTPTGNRGYLLSSQEGFIDV